MAVGNHGMNKRVFLFYILNFAVLYFAISLEINCIFAAQNEIL
jgi:hypothetical protein